MNIIHISAECYPVAKIGGLADVVGALPKYQQKLGVESKQLQGKPRGNSGKADFDFEENSGAFKSRLSSKVIMPLYDNEFTQSHEFEPVYEAELVLGEKTYPYKILKLKEDTLELNILFVDAPDLLFKDFVYSEDDTERFMAFQIAVMDWLLTLEQKPDIIHCHDHHTGIIPFMAQECFKYESLNRIPVILTIHNAQYQGWFSHDKVHYLPAFDIAKVGLLDWDGVINPLAAGIKCAWRVTTVSPSYMGELQRAANGLESLLSHENQKCVGILNGIDSTVWNPESDGFIVKNYSAKNVQTGKAANKKWLCKEFGFSASRPLFAFIGRLVYEKGADIFPEVFEQILSEKKCNILVLGSGNPEVETQLENLKDKYKGVYNAFIGYDEKLSHLIYAGTDFLLMPSRVEPCGLNQMYSLRYGTVPIVRSIGGLKDTVLDFDNGGFGFCHHETTTDNIVKAVKRAIEFYSGTKDLKKTRTHIMGIDHSWDASAQQYIDLYNSIKSGSK